MKNLKLISLSALVLSVATVATVAGAGSGKITGGGMIVGPTGTHLATLTLQCESCSSTATAATGHFNYVDHQTGAHLQGNLTTHVACSPVPIGRGADDCQLFCDASIRAGAHLVFGQTSDGGILSACIQDNGQGEVPPDRAVVVTRPAGQGFRRIGGAVNGNFKVHGS